MSLTKIYKFFTGKLLFSLLFSVAMGAHAQLMPSAAEQEAALMLLKKHAESGDPNAQYDLGYMYDTGRDDTILAKDTRKAAEWYEKAALQGHAKAQAGLGQLHINGDGMPVDYVIGVDWLQKAAAQGNAEAQLELGWLYRDSKGIPDDPAKALQWWKNAAEREFAHAQFTLGLIYNKGEIVPRDIAKTADLWKKASMQGYHPAQFNLGSMYYFGEGVPKDPVKAVGLWEKAAAFGYTDAQFNLALAYYLGSGVKQDEFLAYVWSNLASEYGGNANAKKLRDSIKLTPAQQELANTMFMNWQLGKVYR